MKKYMELATIIGNVVGALLVAVGGSNIQIVGYLFFCVGAWSSIWLLSKSNASRALILVSVYFLVVNIIGIVIRIPSIAEYIKGIPW